MASQYVCPNRKNVYQVCYTYPFFSRFSRFKRLKSILFSRFSKVFSENRFFPGFPGSVDTHLFPSQYIHIFSSRPFLVHTLQLAFGIFIILLCFAMKWEVIIRKGSSQFFLWFLKYLMFLLRSAKPSDKIASKQRKQVV